VASVLTNKAVGLAKKGQNSAKKRKALAGSPAADAGPQSKKGKASESKSNRGKRGLTKAVGVHISEPGTNDIKVLVGVGSNGT
jgi:hypothetical protein